MLDCYALLGVPSTASVEEIRRAWREKAFQLHPDRNPGDDGSSFRAVALAYEILSDPDRREAYHVSLSASPQERRPEGATTPTASSSVSRSSRSAGSGVFLRRAQEDALARRRAYEVEQAHLEAVMCRFGNWTRSGVMRDGSAWRR